MESTTISQRASGSAVHYRWNILSEVRISVCSKPLPEAITLQIDKVFGREISGKRREDLQCIAKHLCNDFVRVLSGASQEDDCVAPIKRALLSMDSRKNFTCARKAGIALLSNVSTRLIMLTLFRLGSMSQA